MSELKLSGTITLINDTNQINDKFKKREFVVTDNGMYPQTIMFQSTQDKCAMLDSYKVGQSVTVDFNLRGRAWESPSGETKYFNTLEAWKIEAANDTITPEVKGIEVIVEADSDLPF